MIIAPTPFFHPTEDFLLWMAEHYGDCVVIDVGCGYGNFVAALLATGCSGAIGIDMLDEKIEAGAACFPEAAGRLLVGDSMSSGICKIPGAVLIWARPCHHAGWIRATVKATANTAKGWLYISKPGNAEHDLDGFERKRVAVGIDVGEDGEEVWEFRPVSSNFADYERPSRWCLVDMRDRRSWVRDGGDRWYWGWGSSYCIKHGETILEDAYVCDDDWLDCTKTTGWQAWHERVDDANLDNGWVSPAGRLYRCAYWEHDSLCYDYLRRITADLEDEGWCKLQHKPGEDDHLFVLRHRRDGREHRLTREQTQTLVDAGFVPPIYMLEEAEGDWSEVIARRGGGLW